MRIELVEVYEDGALVVVEGEDWVVAIPFTLNDNVVTINTEFPPVLEEL